MANRTTHWPRNSGCRGRRSSIDGGASLTAGCPHFLEDRPRGRSFAPLTRAKEAEIIARTQKAPAQATQWSCGSMAKLCGVSKASVQRVWHANGLKPHLLRTFKPSKDPDFVSKLEDVVGLYMNPPEHALVFCIDEKSQIQALDRTQPGLPMKKGRAGTMTHDYKRHGTTTLFAALDVLKGEVIGRCMPQHRHQEFLSFLKTIDRGTPRRLDIHCIADNYATHKKQEVKDWIAQHPRFHLHFIPTSSSWLNLVERWFGKITTDRIRRGVFTSVRQLERAIYNYIERNNADPKPFVWTKSAKDIVSKVNRGRAALKLLPARQSGQL
ncbi:MAG: IS630 family transposase [Methylacidiphilaceae bacterium]|nr:IS630 family transposase [Candidatus Methylacidiphilaceae bacterium]